MARELRRAGSCWGGLGICLEFQPAARYKELVDEEARGWMAALREGGPAAQLQGLSQYLRGVLAKGFGAQLEDAALEDLVQDSVVRIHHKLDSFEGHSRFQTWAASVAVNTALSELRRRKYAKVSLQEAIRAGEQAFEPAQGPNNRQREQRDAALYEAIHSALTDRQRQALLAELGGLPLVEVARRLGTGRGALYKLLHDARKRLRSHFEAQGLGPHDLFEGGEGAW